MTGANEHTDLAVIGSGAVGIYGDSYDVVTCGGTLAFALNSGRIAGRNLLVYVK